MTTRARGRRIAAPASTGAALRHALLTGEVERPATRLQRTWSAALQALPLAGVLAVALLLRLWGTGFGLPHTYYWDEPTVVNRAIRFGSGDLDPHFYFYPAFYMYVLFAVSGAYFVVGLALGVFSGVQDFGVQYFTDPGGVYLWARTTTALFGTATVACLYFVAARHFGRTAGTLAALFLAVSVVHATNSHIAITDVPHVFFIVAALLPIGRIHERGRWRDYLLAGALIGLGAATKYLAVLLLPVAALAHYTSPRARWGQDHLLAALLPPRLSALAGAAALAFTAGAPFNVVHAGAFLNDYREQARLSAGGGGTSFEYLLARVLPGSFGWPLALAAAAGLALLLWRRRRGELWLLLFPALYLLAVGRYAVAFPRYLLPAEPFVALLAGLAVASGVAQLRALRARAGAIAAGALVAALIAAPAYATLRWNADMATTTDTRTAAREWMEANVPEGTSVALQSLFDRTVFNAPLITNQRLAKVAADIPAGGRFDSVRDNVLEELQRSPLYIEAPFAYDLDLLRREGVRYVLTSDLSWDRAQLADPDSQQSRFARALATEATLVQRFTPEHAWPAPRLVGRTVVLPVRAPEITIYELR
jgi:hypothetical protein